MWDDDFFWYWLCNLKGIGSFKIRKIIEKYGDAASAYENFKAGSVYGLTDKDEEFLTDRSSMAKMREDFIRMQDRGVSFVHINHKDYPERLKDIYNSPAALYVLGEMPSESRMTVAVVGARNCSNYGKRVAYDFAGEFARKGVQVVSGLALGVDASAHKGSLDNCGYTCAVMGCGVDVCYPRVNISLYTEIVEKGAVISEYPLNTPPVAGQFPARNRIISGLADAVIVVEARKKSGSLITADYALEQNKDVFAVPGRLGDVLSEGCNELIKMGAQVMTCAEDVCYAGEIGSVKCQSENICNINLLASQKDIVYSCLGLYPKSLDEILEETTLDISVVSEVLLYLQIEGIIQEISKNCYVKVHL